MPSEVTRHIKSDVACELWGRAAGRCEFDGCNRPLYKSPVTQERVNIAQKAHIYSFAASGARGWGPFRKNRGKINDAANLMLVCYDCHKKIDQDLSGVRYSAALLTAWKESHEQRVAINTGVSANKKSHVILYGANIGDQSSPLQPEAAKDALFPEWYPADERVLEISMHWEGRDRDLSYWSTEGQNLEVEFNRQIRALLDHSPSSHLSIFALAPIPLLMKLGALLTDKIPAEVYQLHREPKQSWKWSEGSDEELFRIVRPTSTAHPPALVLSLSDVVAHERVSAALGEERSVWEVTTKRPHNDFLRSRNQLSQFRTVMREVIVEIGRAHGKNTALSIFPAIPVACAVEVGRVRMPKADGVWDIFDQDCKQGGFIHVLTLGMDSE